MNQPLLSTIFLYKTIISYLFITLFAARSVVAAVDINTANAKELAQELSYIGPVKAQRIVEYREQIGGFISPEQLLEVYGIGPKTLERNREKIIFSDIHSVTDNYPVSLDLSPPLAKPPRSTTSSVFGDVMIIMPLLLGCFLIFLKAWLIGKR
jgi:competence protein ComEA